MSKVVGVYSQRNSALELFVQQPCPPKVPCCKQKTQAPGNWTFKNAVRGHVIEGKNQSCLHYARVDANAKCKSAAYNHIGLARLNLEAKQSLQIARSTSFEFNVQFQANSAPSAQLVPRDVRLSSARSADGGAWPENEPRVCRLLLTSRKVSWISEYNVYIYDICIHTYSFTAH